MCRVCVWTVVAARSGFGCCFAGRKNRDRRPQALHITASRLSEPGTRPPIGICPENNSGEHRSASTTQLKKPCALESTAFVPGGPAMAIHARLSRPRRDRRAALGSDENSPLDVAFVSFLFKFLPPSHRTGLPGERRADEGSSSCPVLSDPTHTPTRTRILFCLSSSRSSTLAATIRRKAGGGSQVRVYEFRRSGVPFL